MMKKKLLTFALTATMVAGSVFSTFAADTGVDLTDGLTGYYTFDDTLANAASEGGSAKLHGAAGDTWNEAATGTATYATGKNGKAYSFAGEKTEGLELDITLGEAYTISFWANPTAVTGATSMVFSPVSLDTGLNIADNWFGDTFPTVRMWGVDGTGDVYLDNWVTTADELCGQWTYITLTCDAAGNMVLYINGESAGTGKTGAAVLNGMPVFLGINFWDTTFNGLLDDVAIYSKALSASEVSALYDAAGVISFETETEDPTEDNEEPTTVPSSNTDNPEDESSTPAGSEDETTAGSEDETTAGSEDETTAGSEEEPTVTPGSTVDGEEAGGIQDAADPVKDADGNEYTLKVTAVTEDVLEAVAKAVEAIDELKDATYVVLDLKIEDADGVVITATGEYVVTIPVPAALLDAKAEWVKVLRLEDDGTLKTIDTVEVKDGKITFTTDHFSTYVFAAVDAPKSDASVGDNQQTGDKAPIVPIMVLGAIAVGAVVAVSAKKKNA